MLSKYKKVNTRRSSISKRVTIWYSIFFFILAGVLLFGVYTVSDYYITQHSQTELENAVIDSAGDFHEGDYEVHENGIYLSRYSVAGKLLEGAVPIPLPSNFSHKRLQETKVNEMRYLYYDYFDAEEKMWFRGVVSVREKDLITDNLLRIMLVALPLSLAFILIGGYLIIRRALSPIKLMSTTAQRIEESLDLSQRIQIQKDQTELQQLAHSFNRMLDKVEASYERERQFTGDVSHELRTPIAVIKSEAEYAQTIADLPVEAQESLQIIERQSRQMTKLVTNLLDMTRIEHQTNIEKEMLDFSELVAQEVENFDIIAQAQERILSSSIQPQLTLSGNKQLLKRLIDNLLSNAVKFSQKDIQLSVYEKAGEVVLTVSNDGPVIPKEELDRIWHRMYQGDNSRNSSGLGLGLSFVKKIAELHQAKIEVESQEGHTRFTVSFPKHVQ